MTEFYHVHGFWLRVIIPFSQLIETAAQSVRTLLLSGIDVQKGDH